MTQARTHPAEDGPREPAAPLGSDWLEEQDSPSSLDEVHDRRGALVRLAYRFCWDVDDAEDAVQEALLLASRKRHQLVQKRKLWSWVRSIVVRQCFEIGRRLARERKADAALQQTPPSVAGEAAASDGAERREGDDLVRRMIGTLPERQQMALVLRHLEEMSYRQIAETMDISESTARVQVRNAREALRRAILKRDPVWAADAET